MKTKKMSLANIQGQLSRLEMKKIMAGSSCGSCCFTTATCSANEQCSPYGGYGCYCWNNACQSA